VDLCGPQKSFITPSRCVTCRCYYPQVQVDYPVFEWSLPPLTPRPLHTNSENHTRDSSVMEHNSDSGRTMASTSDSDESKSNARCEELRTEFHAVVSLLSLVSALNRKRRSPWELQQDETDDWPFNGPLDPKRQPRILIANAVAALCRRKHENVAAAVRSPSPGARKRSSSITIVTSGLGELDVPASEDHQDTSAGRSATLEMPSGHDAYFRHDPSAYAAVVPEGQSKWKEIQSATDVFDIM
jgi:hypothetical protein